MFCDHLPLSPTMRPGVLIRPEGWSGAACVWPHRLWDVGERHSRGPRQGNGHTLGQAQGASPRVPPEERGEAFLGRTTVDPRDLVSQ